MSPSQLLFATFVRCYVSLAFTNAGISNLIGETRSISSGGIDRLWCKVFTALPAMKFSTIELDFSTLRQRWLAHFQNHRLLYFVENFLELIKDQITTSRPGLSFILLQALQAIGVFLSDWCSNVICSLVWYTYD